LTFWTAREKKVTRDAKDKLCLGYLGLRPWEKKSYAGCHELCLEYLSFELELGRRGARFHHTPFDEELVGVDSSKRR